MLSLVGIVPREPEQNGVNLMLNFCFCNHVMNFFRLHISDEQLKRRMLMAVPKKGRLYDQCIRLLERAGIKVTIRVESSLICYTCCKMRWHFQQEGNSLIP